ncbi:MAG: 50S ribosomal protein L32 [Bacteroidetes bacterium]|nr:50S ribosomal protein L32 [Bacteroidota bacterium]MCY4206321.1 50S ribosomal protein L32 [Bacteroidota bacterium]
MANPRRKHSKSRTRKRRSVYYGSLENPPLADCEQSGDPKLRHRVCPSSGIYRGRQIIERRTEA